MFELLVLRSDSWNHLNVCKQNYLCEIAIFKTIQESAN